MTPIEARDALSKADPGRVISVTEEHWYYGSISGDTSDSFSIGIQPGENGEDCNVYHGADIELLVTRVLEIIGNNS